MFLYGNRKCIIHVIAITDWNSFLLTDVYVFVILNLNVPLLGSDPLGEVRVLKEVEKSCPLMFSYIVYVDPYTFAS